MPKQMAVKKKVSATPKSECRSLVFMCSSKLLHRKVSPPAVSHSLVRTAMILYKSDAPRNHAILQRSFNVEQC